MKRDSNYQISCLSSAETYSITNYKSLIDSYKFIIPFSYEMVELLEKLKTFLPFNYIIYEKEQQIYNVTYYLMNDYLIVQFHKENERN